MRSHVTILAEKMEPPRIISDGHLSRQRGA